MTMRTLETEFPDLADSIRHLIQDSIQFKTDRDSYHKLDKAIRGLEERGIATDDDHFKELKTQRARLKDQLYLKAKQHQP
ncbi:MULTISPECIES: YdcH family protein [Microbulbifer]|uniref:YdcH family protein n=1 Tax=Microbulbifer salipaludis TaxID=187980 RepID=A0ABS3E6B4_9GAMM|nr:MULTISPECIES: YdcH family protein [Microbulbifer]MBN8430845.1 YdcH family protein [Microbulbifer salipaludis]